MPKIDEDGLMDFSDEEGQEEEQGSTALNFDPDDDGDDDDGSDLRSLLLGEEDYEDDEGEEGSGEGGSEEDGSEQQDESFKNEENARNAERRRQEEATRLEQLRQQSPEYQLVQRMSQMTGQTPEQIMARLEEEQMKAQAVQQGIPLEMYRMVQQTTKAAQAAEARAQQLEFDAWNSRVDQDMTRLQSELPMISQDELVQAKAYILQTLKNTSVSLETAVYALHGKKIADGMKDSAHTEALAQVSGRKKSASVPLSSKPASQPKGLTDAERAAARALGMSAADYIKYR